MPGPPERVLDQMHAAQRPLCLLVARRGARWSGQPARPLALLVCPQREEGPSSPPWHYPFERGVEHRAFNVLCISACEDCVRLVQPVLGGDTLLAFLTAFTADPVQLLLIRYLAGPHDIRKSLDAVGKTEVQGAP